MADINLNNGHRYTFGKINDNPVLSESTDFVQETAVFRQGIQATGSVSVDANSTEHGFRLFNGNENLANILLEYSDSAVLSLYDNNVRRVKISGHTGTSPNYINNSNDFGIGTDSPEARLHVNSGNTNIAGHFESTDGTIRLLFEDTAHTSSIGHDSTRMSLGYKYIGHVDNLSIRTNGNVGVGDANPSRKFVVKDNTAGTGNPAILFENGGTGNQEVLRLSFPDNTNIGNQAEYISFFANGVEVGTIEGGTSGNQGDVVLDGFASDLRLKRDIVYLSSSYDALGLINDIDVIEYEYINEASPTPIRHVGYSAQNLLEVFPNPVRTYDDKNERDGLSPGDHGYRYHKVHYERMTPLLTQAIKELTSEIESLKARIQELENK